MGSKTPPPEPDYTKERAAFAQSEFANRQRQAERYNNQISMYNSAIGGLNSTANQLGNQFGRLTIADDEKFNGLENQLAALDRRYNNITGSRVGSLVAPDWGSTVNSAYGVVDVGIPRLLQRNEQAGMNLQTSLGDLRTKLQGLRDDRKAEEQRIDTFANGLASTLSGYQTRAGQIGIEDIGDINSLRQSLAEARSGLEGFSSAILGEYKTDAKSRYNAQIDAINNSLQGILDQRTAEENRIKAFEGGLNSAYDSLASRFGNLTIADAAGMDALQREIDAQQLSAGRFSSKLGFDLNDELSGYNDLEARLASLRSQREAEQSRVQSAQADANSGVMSILNQLGTANIDNQGALNSIGLAIDQGRRDISGFSSVLGGDFNGVTGQLDSAQAQLEALRAQRSAALSGYGTQMNDLLAAINGYDLTNESGIRSGLTKAQQLAGELGQFSGVDANPYTAQARSLVDAANSRLNALGSKRGDIENLARQLLNNSRATQYSDAAALDALAAQLGDINNQVTSYGATQAQDEIDAITGFISGERARLAADAKAAAERQAQEQASYNSFSPAQGFSSFYAAAAPWMSGGPRSRYGQLPSSFARQLGVIYA